MKYKVAAACIFAALSQTPHALAATGTVTYFGVVDNTQQIDGQTEPAPDRDVAKLFGGGNLEGDFITATYVYDTSQGIGTLTSGSSELDGGSAFSASDPITSASFSIQRPGSTKTYTYTYTPDYYADVYTSTAGLDEIAYSTAGDQSYSYINTSTTAPANLSTSFSALGYGPASYLDPGLTNTKKLDSIVFDTLSVTVSATPEPSTWVMMFAGVGLIGAAMRFGIKRRSWVTTSA